MKRFILSLVGCLLILILIFAALGFPYHRRSFFESDTEGGGGQIASKSVSPDANSDANKSFGQILNGGGPAEAPHSTSDLRSNEKDSEERKFDREASESTEILHTAKLIFSGVGDTYQIDYPTSEAAVQDLKAAVIDEKRAVLDRLAFAGLLLLISSGDATLESVSTWILEYEPLRAEYVNSEGGYFEATLQERWLKVLASSEDPRAQRLLAEVLPTTYRFVTMSCLEFISTWGESSPHLRTALLEVASQGSREPDERLKAVDTLFATNEVVSESTLREVLADIRVDVKESYAHDVQQNLLAEIERVEGVIDMRHGRF